jgi:AcrR family transcriptional regulator
MPGALADDPAGPAPSYDDDTPRVGRPRDPRVDASVRAATLQLLVEDGYQATSIQAVARRAGVSAPSIYRRWASKAELIEEAVFPTGQLVEPALTGDIGGDLETYCRGIVEHLSDPAVRAAIPGLLTEYQTDPELFQRLVQRSLTPMREAFADFVAQTGREPVADVPALFDVMIGALFVRAISTGAADADAFAGQVARVVSAALVGGGPA